MYTWRIAINLYDVRYIFVLEMSYALKFDTFLFIKTLLVTHHVLSYTAVFVFDFTGFVMISVM